LSRRLDDAAPGGPNRGRIRRIVWSTGKTVGKVVGGAVLRLEVVPGAIVKLRECTAVVP
jgi:hypothetical protein